MTDLTDAYDNAKPGDPAIDHDHSEEGWCTALHDGWECARPVGHGGQHVAESDVPAEVVDVWPNEWTPVDVQWCTEHNSESRYDFSSCVLGWGSTTDCRFVPCYIRTEDQL